MHGTAQPPLQREGGDGPDPGGKAGTTAHKSQTTATVKRVPRVSLHPSVPPDKH